jgi:hypothetical protein
MNPQKQTAAYVSAQAAGKNESHAESYLNRNTPSRISSDRLQKIAEYKRQIPNAYRKVYEKAVLGKSLRASINSFCLSCVCWQRKEISLCTALACSLWMVRPYQEILQEGVK